MLFTRQQPEVEVRPFSLLGTPTRVRVTVDHIQVGGTLSANPLSSAAGHFAIEEMARTTAPVIASIG